jgi:hypothetical protein
MVEEDVIKRTSVGSKKLLKMKTSLVYYSIHKLANKKELLKDIKTYIKINNKNEFIKQ